MNVKLRGCQVLRLALIGATAMSMLALGGCRERQYNRYLRASDTIALSAGDAIAHNKAVHTIDPWPAHARRTHQSTDGKRMLLSVRRYQDNAVIEPEGLITSDTYDAIDGPPPPPPPGGNSP